MKINKNNIIVTSHALERAKQRLNYIGDKNCILFETYIKDLFIKSYFVEFDKGNEIYLLKSNNQNIKFVVQKRDAKVIIVTVNSKG